MNEIGSAHVRASNFFGGPEKQILGHALQALKRPASGMRVAVMSFNERGRETELVSRARAAGVEAHSIRCRSAYDPVQVAGLKKAFAAAAPDVVCTHDYRSSLLCLLALRGSAIPQVVFWRGATRENLKVKLFHRMERLVMRSVSHVVVVSEEQRAFLTSRGFPPGKLSLVPNAVDVEGAANGGGGGLERVVGGLDARTVLVTASRLSPEKGLSHLVDAMPAVLREDHDITLLIFGDGPLMASLRSQAARLNCGRQVRFAGLVPDFASLVGEADVFVLPSLSEGLPNALLEAMAAGRPVVTTGVGGVKDLVRDGENGLVVPPGDSGALAAAILRLASDRKLAERLGRSARETVGNTHSFARQFELLENVLRGVSRRG